MGTLTIKRNKVSLADTLLLMAGGFAHTIAVEGVEFAGSNIYFDRVLEKFTFDDTPAPGCRDPDRSRNITPFSITLTCGQKIISGVIPL